MEIRTIPEIPRIGADAEKLYTLEGKRNEAIKAAAKEHGRILLHEEGQFWDKTMPEQLASILENYERAASIAAALGYLRQFGQVEMKFKDGHVLTLAYRKAGAS